MKQGLYGFGLAAAIASLVFWVKTKKKKEEEQEQTQTKESNEENNK